MNLGERVRKSLLEVSDEAEKEEEAQLKDDDIIILKQGK